MSACKAREGNKRVCTDGVTRRTCKCCGKTYGYGFHCYDDGSITFCDCSNPFLELHKEDSCLTKQEWST